MACEMGWVPWTGAVWVVDFVAAVNAAYAHIHPYVAVVLCLAGTVMNAVTVVVLTRPSMRSAVNSLLCAIAVCDILVMSSVLVFVTHFLILAGFRCQPSDYSRFWAFFLFSHAQATVIFHATSIWLTVLLAQIRVFSIRRATTLGSELVSTKATIAIAAATLLVVVALNVPNFLTFEIMEIEATTWLPCLANQSSLDSNEMVYLVRPSEHCGLLKIAFWTNGVLFKVVPCVLLTFSIIALVNIIRDVSNRKKMLAQVMNKKRMPRDHTTPMLVAVLSIFLFAELPQGLLHVLNAVFSKETFYDRIYQQLGDVMDVLSLLNSAVNFIIYCAMSRKFRSVFVQIFLSCLPERLYRKYITDWNAVVEYDFSNRKPSALTTDMTKTEQLALTSHRVSATSMLITPTSRNEHGKMYSGNLLTTGGRSQRVSFEANPKQFGARRSLEIHQLQFTVPPPKTQRPPAFQRFLQIWRRGESPESSPCRRINLLQCETSTSHY
ncbi:unnamed protein product [Caenorhabditis auriculariae]|uniref:G-protein coupled receptors family 1 profile domain-containing protein n=1 Tax=Caenorhabditis auriculariae TaxID=2777116 RepID=A0A8S1HDK7_9PELO|nr:unnamed protein product [Caenorhabditis auriculariae]